MDSQIVAAGLTGLPWRTGVRTRQISAENPTGQRNQGARAVPDPTDPSLPHSRAAAELGVGFKVRPFIRVLPGETQVLADIAGAGSITNFYLTSNVLDLKALRLQVFWDDADDAAVDVDVASFFCLGGNGQPHNVTSLPINVGPTRGCSSSWPMPFSKRALITLTNEAATAAEVIAYKVTYEEMEPSAVGASRFHARTVNGRPDPVTGEFDLVRQVGEGIIVGTSINWRANGPRWWGEGQVKVYFGDDEYPTIVDTGTEDYFGGAWGFGRDSTFLPSGPPGEQTFSGPYAGVPFMQINEGYVREVVLYRWHINDPIGFGDGVRMAVQVIGIAPTGQYEIRGDDLSATGYWYHATAERH